MPCSCQGTLPTSECGVILGHLSRQDDSRTIRAFPFCCSSLDLRFAGPRPTVDLGPRFLLLSQVLSRLLTATTSLHTLGTLFDYSTYSFARLSCATLASLAIESLALKIAHSFFIRCNSISSQFWSSLLDGSP